jgi:hypothetical protein
LVCDGMSDNENNSTEQGGKGKRPYTMSEAALEARRANAQLSTGPRTEEGKAASSRNAWKTGEHSAIAKSKEWQALMPMWQATGKPCQTTCDKYPCSLVKDGVTQAGGNCMDKTVFVQAFDAIMNSLSTGDAQHAHGMMGMLAASSVDILVAMRDEIATKGVLVMVPVFDKNGKKSGDKPILNPAIPHYTKLLAELGINLPELMLTPRATSKLGEVEDTENAFATMLGNALQRAGQGGPVRRHTIDVTPEKE